MWWFHEAGGWWVWVVMPMAMLVFWGFTLWAIVTLVGGSDQRAARPAFGPAPEEVLAERYARGEIDTDEYRQRLATLRRTKESAV